MSEVCVVEPAGDGEDASESESSADIELHDPAGLLGVSARDLS